LPTSLLSYLLAYLLAFQWLKEMAKNE